MTSTPSGWYRDPTGAESLRWWDGTTWTAATREPGAVARTFRHLPWRGWLASTGAIVLCGLILFGHAETTSAPNPDTSYGLGFAVIGAIVLVTASLTLARRRWTQLLVYVAVAASATAFALYAVTSPSTSRSCNNSGEPRSPGTYDCDTSDGLGGPILIAILSVPTAAVATVGKLGGDAYYAFRGRITIRRRAD